VVADGEASDDYSEDRAFTANDDATDFVKTPVMHSESMAN